MKKNKLLNLLFLSLFLLGSCGEKGKQVSLFIYTSDDTFIQTTLKYFDEVFNNINIDIKKYDANRSQSLQNEQITEEIESKENDVLIVNTVDRLADSAIIEKAKRYETPIIFFNREPLDRDLPTTGHYYYVGSDFKNEAYLQADMIATLFGNPNNLNNIYDKNADGIIQFVMLKGEQGHQDMENRSKYVIESLRDKGYKTEFLTSAYCNWRRDTAKESFSSMYKEYGDEIELIISNNDDMALGAIDYLLENNIFSKTATSVSEQPIQIVGVDGTEVAKDAIKNHLMYGTALNDAKKQVEVILDLTTKIINKEDINDDLFDTGHKIYIKGKSITLDNIND
jgi:methyl-galactoside transport system substrate-binding protein